MTSRLLSRDNLNFQCVTVASVDFIKLPLIDILANQIKPEDLYNKISSCKDLLKGSHKLSYDQRQVCYIQQPDYKDFDVTLLYKLIRHLCVLPSPRNGWGNPPQANDTEMSDDIERLRLFRNSYHAHADSAAIPYPKFQVIWKDLSDVISRFQKKIQCSVDYRAELVKIERYPTTVKHFEACKNILGSIQQEREDEADFSIKGENKVICGGITKFEANMRKSESVCGSITWQKLKGYDFEDINTQNEKYSGSTNRILVIQSVRKEDEGEYRAVLSIKTDHEKSSNTILLHVLGDPPFLHDLNVTTGHDEVTIHCSYKTLELSPNVKGIEWRKNGVLLDQNNKKFDVNKSCYTIKSPKKENTGEYSCIVFNDVGSVQKDVMLDFPSAKILVHHKNVKYGSTIKIMSEVVSNPRAEKFEWQKRLDGNLFVCIDIAKPNYFGSNLVHDTPVLVIPKATFDDKGHYRLAIWNKFGENVSNIIDLKITGSRPNITTSQMSNIEEQSETLCGNVFLFPDSPPIQDAYWTKDGKKIDIEGSGGRISFDFGNKKLIIKEVGEEDAGNYKLTATNSIGSTTSDAIFLGRPWISIERTENKENGSQTFTATIKSVPTPFEIRWDKKGMCDDRFQPIDVSDEEYKGTTNSLPHPVLVLKQKSQLENNSYQITVKNFVGSTVFSELEKEEVCIKKDLAMTFPLSFAQDAVRCVLCGNYADFYCKQCSLTLCWNCTSNHFEKIKHANQESTPKKIFKKSFPECNKHVKKTCELYCKDCTTPICSTCVTGDHRKHNCTSLEDFIEEKKENIAKEVQEIHSTILPALKEQTSSVNEDNYNDTIQAISSHEDSLCKAVREVGSKLKSQLCHHREENIAKTSKNVKKEKEILQFIKATTLLLDGNDPREILKYKGICQMDTRPFIVDRNTPVFKGKGIEQEEIISLFGTLADSKDNNEEIGTKDFMKQTWFHGFIPKKEAEQLLKKNGDFLVREMMTNAEQDRYFISSYHKCPCHFKITTDYIVGIVGTESTLVDLIDFLVSSGQPLSKTNPSTLKFPVNRSHHQLDSCQIKLGEKIENISAGDILSGTFGTQNVLVCINDDHEIRLFKNIYILRIFNHPNIVKMEGYSSLQKPVHLVLENMAGGSLLTYLRSNDVSLSTKKRTRMCHNVATAMEYLHRNKFIHGDVAARNCLVSESGIVKVYDFWMTKNETDHRKQNPIERELHIKWTAPETLEFGKIISSSDVWGFGILMWEIFSSGKSPYPHFTDKETKEKVVKGYKMESPENTPKLCYNLMQKCWEKHAKRPSFKDIAEKLQTLVKKQK